MFDPADIGLTYEESLTTPRWLQTSAADAGYQETAELIGNDVDALLDQMNEN